MSKSICVKEPCQNQSVSRDHVRISVCQGTMSELDLVNENSDSTVRKSDAKKRRAFQPIEAIPSPPLPRSAHPPPPPISSQVAPPVNESDNNSEQSSRSRRGSHSDNSSSVSQTSYDPSQPNFRNMDGEIPDFSGDSQSGEITVVSTKFSGSKGKKCLKTVVVFFTLN
ncbi:bromodomain testis-specific protein-like [Haliotis rubra]|uniref:bromodomain testis-specific protein-like n=1 Tax=Haliotis rubra TaxID=36100 RepID=UPI001EE56EC5|nr:bromodomain testis-specific protein-like [Haliotis rubra]